MFTLTAARGVATPALAMARTKKDRLGKVRESCILVELRLVERLERTSCPKSKGAMVEVFIPVSAHKLVEI